MISRIVLEEISEAPMLASAVPGGLSAVLVVVLAVK